MDDEIAGIVESIADIDADGAEDLKVDKQPLTKALSSLGIEAKGVENDPRGLSLVFSSPEEYRAAHAILNEPDSLHKLAELGWVYSTQGDVAMANEQPELRIRFLEIDEIEPQDAKASYSASDKTRLNKVKDIIKKGREFATTAPDFDRETNPVDHGDPKKGKRDKGVGDAKDGSDPEGKPKGSTGNPSAGKSGSQPGKGDLTQPSEGDNAKMAKQEGLDYAKRLKALRKRRGEPVGEAAFVSHGDGTGTYDGPGYAKPTRMAAHPINFSQGFKSQLQQAVQHAPGCDCDDCAQGQGEQGDPGMFAHTGQPDCQCYKCTGEPHTMGRAAAGQNSGRPWGIGEGGHKSGCKCTFCTKYKGKGFGKKSNEKPEGGMDADGEETDESTAAEIVNSMLEGNPGTPPGIMGTKSFKTMKVPGGSKDRKFQPAKGMVQAAPENSVVAKQTKPNRSA
ncbi:MAG: hypothetical protein ACOYB3_00155 [Azonexus sp.]